MKRGHALAVLVACTLGGCLSTYNPAIAASYDDRRARLDAWLFANSVNWQCDGKNSAPATHTVKPSGVYATPHTQPCGLIANEVQSPAYKTEYVTKVCGGTADAACFDRYERTFLARLAERYLAADLSAIQTRCTAHPIECSTMMTLEIWVLESHNAAVRAQYDASLQATGSIYQQEQGAYAARARASNAAAWQGVADAFKPQPQINCTSTTLGTTTTTRCQ